MYYGGQNSREFSKSVWNPTLKGRCQIGVPWGYFSEPVGHFGGIASMVFGIASVVFGIASVVLAPGFHLWTEVGTQSAAQAPKVGIVAAVDPQMDAIWGSLRPPLSGSAGV